MTIFLEMENGFYRMMGKMSNIKIPIHQEHGQSRMVVSGQRIVFSMKTTTLTRFPMRRKRKLSSGCQPSKFRKNRISKIQIILFWH